MTSMSVSVKVEEVAMPAVPPVDEERGLALALALALALSHSPTSRCLIMIRG